MKTIYLYLFSLFILSSVIISCDVDSQGDNFEDDREFTSGKKGNGGTDFEKLDRKMHEIMNETYGDEDGPTKEVRVIQAKDAQTVDVNLKIGAGKLKLSGGASELLIAGFIFSDELWKPEINYQEVGEKGVLIIEQPRVNDFNLNDEDKYVWNLKFNDRMPLDFTIELGAGISEIALGGMDIGDFSMVMGVGKSEIDLRGEWKKNTTINLTGGIGLSRIYLPQNTGVRLNVDKGIGALDFTGLIQKGRNQYVNKLVESADILVTVNLKTGIGKIEIE